MPPLHQPLSKTDVFALTTRHLQPHRTGVMRQLGIDLVIAEREGYVLRDMEGREFFDLHLNGGTYNLGHRHPKLLSAFKDALDMLDVGNHHFASPWRVALTQKLVKLAPGEMPYVAFASGGAEAVDLAIKASRHTTRRRKVVSIERGYHGRTGLSGAAGDDSAARYFLSDDPSHFIKVPFNDLEAMRHALSSGDVACALMETIPATYGFPLPYRGYLPAVADLCKQHGTLYIADEVQTGLGRTGSFWGVESFGVQPDILVTSKGLGGGLYPIAATLMTTRAGRWLEEDGWAHVSTFGGAELGCVVAQRVLELTTEHDTVSNADAVARQLGRGLKQLATEHDYLQEIRQCGLVIGLRFAHPQGALHMMTALFDVGVWAIFSGYDLSTLQFKPGLLLTESECSKILERFEKALCVAERRRHEQPMRGFSQ